MKSSRTAGILFLGSLLGACSAPAEAHPAPRCDVDGACPGALVCHAGFCIPPEEEVVLGTHVTVDSFHASDAGAHGDAQGLGEPDGENDDPEILGMNDDATSVPSGNGSGQEDGDGDDDEQQDENAQGESPSLWLCEELCCATNLTTCSAACIDLLSSLTDCEICGSECESPEGCVGDECCKGDEILCDGECVNPAKDKHNCGGCGEPCMRGPCKDGICEGDP